MLHYWGSALRVFSNTITFWMKASTNKRGFSVFVHFIVTSVLCFVKCISISRHESEWINYYLLEQALRVPAGTGAVRAGVTTLAPAVSGLVHTSYTKQSSSDSDFGQRVFKIILLWIIQIIQILTISAFYQTIHSTDDFFIQYFL